MLSSWEIKWERLGLGGGLGQVQVLGGALIPGLGQEVVAEFSNFSFVRA